LADNASPRNGRVIRCPICSREREYECILEGSDQMALVAEPCVWSSGFYTIQKIPKNEVPPDVSADKRIALRVEVENFDDNVLTNEEFQELIANARETGTLLQTVQRGAFPDGIKPVPQNVGLPLPRRLGLKTSKPKLSQVVTHFRFTWRSYHFWVCWCCHILRKS